MKKLLCLLLTLLLIHPALAEDALDAPDAASLLSCADGALLAVSADLRVLRRDTAGDWALILSAEQISAACPPRFMPDAANALLLPGENGAYALLLLPDTSGQIAVLSLTGATCVLTRVFADFLPTDSEMTAQWTLLSAARAGNTLYAAFSSNFATYSTYALSLADGASFLLLDAPIRFLMPLADGPLLACERSSEQDRLLCVCNAAAEPRTLTVPDGWEAAEALIGTAPTCTEWCMPGESAAILYASHAE